MIISVAEVSNFISNVAAETHVVPGSVRTFQGTSDKGPWQEPKDEFETLLNNPNATGNFPIDGPNISTSTSTRIIEGWSWSIAVVADLPIANSSTFATDYGDKFYTGGTITFNAPSSLLSSPSKNLSVDDNREICLFSWQLDGVAYPSKLRSDDGSCTSILSIECINDLKVAAKLTSTGNCRCPIAKDIPSCAALGNDSALWSSTCAGSYHNASDIRKWEDGKLEKGVFGGEMAHERGNSSAYNYIGSLAWPFMASFYGGGETITSLSCVRARDAAKESTAPTGEGVKDGPEEGTKPEGEGDDDGEDGSGNHMYASWILLSAVLVSGMILQ